MSKRQEIKNRSKVQFDIYDSNMRLIKRYTMFEIRRIKHHPLSVHTKSFHSVSYFEISFLIEHILHFWFAKRQKQRQKRRKGKNILMVLRRRRKNDDDATTSEMGHNVETRSIILKNVLAL